MYGSFCYEFRGNYKIGCSDFLVNSIESIKFCSNCLSSRYKLKAEFYYYALFFSTGHKIKNGNVCWWNISWDTSFELNSSTIFRQVWQSFDPEVSYGGYFLKFTIMDGLKVMAKADLSFSSRGVKKVKHQKKYSTCLRNKVWTK